MPNFLSIIALCYQKSNMIVYIAQQNGFMLGMLFFPRVILYTFLSFLLIYGGLGVGDLGLVSLIVCFCLFSSLGLVPVAWGFLGFSGQGLSLLTQKKNLGKNFASDIAGEMPQFAKFGNKLKIHQILCLQSVTLHLLQHWDQAIAQYTEYIIVLGRYIPNFLRLLQPCFIIQPNTLVCSR